MRDDKPGDSLVFLWMVILVTCLGVQVFGWYILAITMAFEVAGYCLNLLALRRKRSENPADEVKEFLRDPSGFLAAHRRSLWKAGHPRRTHPREFVGKFFE